MGKTRAVAARERARRIKARLDAGRAQRDALIEQHQTAFFVAVAEKASADEQMAASVSGLSGLSLSAEEIAELLEVSAREVRGYLRVAEASTATREPELTDARA